MAGVPDATQEEINNGGRTMEQIAEDMRQEKERNPGPIKKFMNQVKSKAVQTAKLQAKSAVRQYLGMIGDAAKEAGLDALDSDNLFAGAFTNFVDEASEDAADVAVNGMTPEEQIKAKALEEENSEEKSQKGAYVPTEKDGIRMQLAENEALKHGQATKKLQYTKDQMAGMTADGITQAGKVGLVSIENMQGMGLDVSAVVAAAGKTFGVTPAALAETMVVPKVKVLPELAPQAQFGLESSGVVMSENDMSNRGDNEIFNRSREQSSVMKEVASATVGVGEQALSGADLAKARGAMADDSLGMAAIEANQKQSLLEDDGFIKF